MKKLLGAPAKSGLLCLFAAGVLGWWASTAGGASRQWTGSGGNNAFSNPNNWNPAGVPQDHDILVFSAGADADNDMLPPPLLDGIVFNGAGTAHLHGFSLHV